MVNHFNQKQQFVCNSREIIGISKIRVIFRDQSKMVCLFSGRDLLVVKPLRHKQLLLVYLSFQRKVVAQSAVTLKAYCFG